MNLSAIKHSWNVFFKRYVKFVAILILIVMLCLEIFSAYQESQTLDEAAHLLAGYQYWQDYSVVLNPEHPPLIKQLAALPLLFMDLNYPWEDPTQIIQWPDSDAFLYELGNPADTMIFWGRLPIMLLSLLLGWFIFKWTRQIAGNYWAIFALILFAFDPNIIAHSRYITTDIGVSCFMFMTMYFYWRFFLTEKMKDLIFLSVALGFAMLSKFSALVIGPAMLIILVAVKHFKKNINYLWLVLIGTLIVVSMITAFYYFEPIKYFEGFQMVNEHNSYGHDSYLLGENGEDGWWYYFLVAFAVKTPVITLAFFAGSLLYFFFFCISLFKKGEFKKNKKTLQTFLFLLLPIGVYFAISMTSKINLGVRHLLPIYPFVFVFIAYSFSQIGEKMQMKMLKNSFSWLIFAVLLIYMASAIIVFPNYLSYFNAGVGGSENGLDYLSDSNIDWGQGLKAMAKYMEENNIDEPIYMNYFGRAFPEYYGIEEHEWWDGEKKDRLIFISRSYIVAEDSTAKWLLDIEPKDVIAESIEVYDFR
ncbi:glycosyltransferase family 39 protein [Patescibacteria group bacterium]|nr:glycosyltransferase family 39 protein [Patescibacteria group bacterium]MBU1673212.1 glycosyltransferase family 39 protein [Patescibacteria group bacterium]MBU1963090.1 glycosyltransferase family 39 protein [Patescibacteria group bacterium]